MLQRVVDLFPRTPGDQVARAALTQQDRLVEPTFARLVAMHDDKLDLSGRYQVREAVVLHGFPEAIDWLEGLLDLLGEGLYARAGVELRLARRRTHSGRCAPRAPGERPRHRGGPRRLRRPRAGLADLAGEVTRDGTGLPNGDALQRRAA